jgi:hypothetical protein
LLSPKSGEFTWKDSLKEQCWPARRNRVKWQTFAYIVPYFFAK